MLKQITQFFSLIIAITILNACSLKGEKINPKIGNDTLLITNAVIYDGSGGTAYRGNIQIRNGVIVAIGDMEAQKGENIIWDAGGLAVAPGFIDPHSHYNEGFKDNLAPASVLAQGITTVIAGVDGYTSRPLKEIFPEFENNPAAVNMAVFGPHNNYRSTVMGENFRRVTTVDEVEAMAKLLKADLELGAIGLGTGLEYEPALYSNTMELITLAKVASSAGGRYSSHIRSEDVNFNEALDELITIAREANIPANISHLKMAMAALWGQAPKIMKKLNSARAEGLNITADVYPYDGWQSTMQVLLPKRNLEDRKAYEYALKSIALPSTIIVTRYEPAPSFVGKTLLEIAKEADIDPVDMLMRMIQITSSGKMGEMIIGRNIGEEDIKKFLKWPFTSISSDGMIDDRHPRGQGAFPRILAKYVREKNILSLPEAIRKMTSLTAHSLGFENRGLIKKGYAADIILFDPELITDHATFADPVQYSTGIKAVWVNGILVWQDGKATQNRPGRIIRRAKKKNGSEYIKNEGITDD